MHNKEIIVQIYRKKIRKVFERTDEREEFETR